MGTRKQATLLLLVLSPLVIPSMCHRHWRKGPLQCHTCWSVMARQPPIRRLRDLFPSIHWTERIREMTESYWRRESASRASRLVQTRRLLIPHHPDHSPPVQCQSCGTTGKVTTSEPVTPRHQGHSPLVAWWRLIPLHQTTLSALGPHRLYYVQ